MEFAFPAAAGKTAIEMMTPAKTGGHMLGLKQVFIVALGGAIGSVARYKLGGFALHHTQAWNFPVSTFAVNVAGCFAIGALAALVEHHDLFSPSVRLFLFTGLLGGFTTFSAFGYESVFLLRRGLLSVAAGYVLLSVVCGLSAVLIGIKLIDQFWPPHH
jgi:fluoride exporter